VSIECFSWNDVWHFYVWLVWLKTNQIN
jgi:hypothetical protein